MGLPLSMSLLDFGHGVFAGGGGIAGAVGQEDAIGLHGQNVFRRGVGRNDGDIAAHGREAAQDIALEAVIDGDDLDTCRRAALV